MLRIRKLFLIEAFKEIDFFNQDHLTVYSITVSGSLDHRDLLADMNRLYGAPHHFSMLVTSIDVNQIPLDNVPIDIKRILQLGSDTPVITEASANHPITGASSYVPTMEPPVDLPLSGSISLSGRQMALPPVDGSQGYSAPPPTSIATIGASSLLSLSELAASTSHLPLTKRPQEGLSSSSRSSTSQISKASSAIIRPIPLRPILEFGQPSSSKAIHPQTSVIPKKRGPKPKSTVTFADESPESSILKCSEPSYRKRERDTDQDQKVEEEVEEEEEVDDDDDDDDKLVRRSRRIKKQQKKVIKYAK